MARKVYWVVKVPFYWVCQYIPQGYSQTINMYMEFKCLVRPK